jgi:hypothetical protein
MMSGRLDWKDLWARFTPMSMIGAALGCSANPHSSDGPRDCFAFVWAIAMLGLKLIGIDCGSDRGYALSRENWNEFTCARKDIEQKIFTALQPISVQPARRVGNLHCYQLMQKK